MSTIRILSGSYRNNPVAGEVFTLVKGYQVGKKGGFVTVKNDGQFAVGGPQVRVNVESIENIQFMNGEVVENIVEFNAKAEVPSETEEEAMNRIATRFAVLDEMSKACISGDIQIGRAHV